MTDKDAVIFQKRSPIRHSWSEQIKLIFPLLSFWDFGGAIDLPRGARDTGIALHANQLSLVPLFSTTSVN